MSQEIAVVTDAKLKPCVTTVITLSGGPFQMTRMGARRSQGQGKGVIFGLLERTVTDIRVLGEPSVSALNVTSEFNLIYLKY